MMPSGPFASAPLNYVDVGAEIDGDEGAALVAILYADEHAEKNDIPGSTALSGPSSISDALGIGARWRQCTQDVDFERKLLLRALLVALPPRAYRLPDGVGSLDDLDLVPLRVQPILEALEGRRRV